MLIPCVKSSGWTRRVAPGTIPSEAWAVRRAGAHWRRAEYTDTQAHTSYI